MKITNQMFYSYNVYLQKNTKSVHHKIKNKTIEVQRALLSFIHMDFRLSDLITVNFEA